MFGSPKESRDRVRTVTLDLPAEVGSVYEPDGDRPPIEAYGPLDRDDDISEMDPRLPKTKKTDGSVVKFTFDEPLGPGAWKIVVYQSRIRREDNGEGFELTDEDGNPWNSWIIQVLDESPARQAPEPGTREGKPKPTRPPAKVCLDDVQLPTGASELSGEVLKAEVHRPGGVDLEVEPLLSGAREPLYSRYRTEILTDEKQERPHNKRVFRWASAGPIQAYKWAHFKGTTTKGRLQISDGQLAYGTAVTRPPKHPGPDPLLEETTATESPSAEHPNTYNTAYYTVTPESVDVGIDSYDSPLLVAPETINDSTNTPETNPRLYPNGNYFPDGLPASRVAVFDLPINCRLRLRVGGSVCWWGQTRLVPTLVEPRVAAQQVPDASADTPQDRADLQRAIWRASMEALRLWGSPLPTDSQGNGVVVSTMRDYVLTAVAMGAEHEEGTQGQVTGMQGEHQFSARSDRTLRRRKHRLAEMLKKQKKDAPPMPEDHAPGAHAEIGSSANTPQYGRSDHSVSEDIAAIYDPTRTERISYEHMRRDLTYR